MNTNRLPPWTEDARRLLEASAQELDAATLSRLNRARQAALAQRRPRPARAWFLSAGLASACAMLVAVAVVWHAPESAHMKGGAAPTESAIGAGDLDIVAAEDGLEFYQDLDFYAWLDAQNPDGNG
jgi:ferric-dicitrate binding protein FerR (iron transport regulator)